VGAGRLFRVRSPDPSGSREPGRGHGLFAAGDGLKVYVSFGTVIWRYYAETALRALHTLADAFAGQDSVQAVISLGGAEPGAAARADLARPNVQVEDYVDQQAVLAGADLFVTHHGMNSTHEAIVRGVPMLSYPFFWTSRAGAEMPGTGTGDSAGRRVQGRFTTADVARALDTLRCRSTALRSALGRARAWEEAVVAKRPEVIRRIVRLIA